MLEAAARHADLAVPLDIWYRLAEGAEWKSLSEVRRHFPSADAIGKHTVFNIKGNTYRLIVEINYRRLFVRRMLTHGRRELTKAQIARLSEYFLFSPEIFF